MKNKTRNIIEAIAIIVITITSVWGLSEIIPYFTKMLELLVINLKTSTYTPEWNLVFIIFSLYITIKVMSITITILSTMWDKAKEIKKE